jgi:ArsR family transcriptional regulator, arsenate/arsenite/antimonite-responsive transcriptional repressor
LNPEIHRDGWLSLDVRLYFHNIGDMEKADAITALGALAQESRLDIFRLLVQAGTEGMPAGQIGERLNLPSATLSFHLNQHKQADLVTFRREGRSLIYSAAYPAMNALIGYLTENCCQGRAAQCAPALCKPSELAAARQKERA